MEVIKQTDDSKVLIEDVMPGVAFSWGSQVFMRIPTLELVVVGHEVLRNVVGIDLVSGMLFSDDVPGQTFVLPVSARIELS